MKKNLVALTSCTLLVFLQSASATLFFEEGFNYPTGGLGGNGNWLGGSGQMVVGTPSLTYAGLADVANPGGNLQVTSGASGSMTINFNSTAITSGSVYYSFLAQATALPTANNYLTDLLPGGASPNGSGDPLAVYVGQQVAGSQFKIGVRHQGIGTGATYTSTSAMTLGAVNLFVVKYTFGSGGTVSLFVNPTPGDPEPTPVVTVGAGGTEAANLQAIGFKAQSATTAGNWIFDTLRVGDTWADVTPLVPEPSTLALAGLALFGVVLRRQLRR